MDQNKVIVGEGGNQTRKIILLKVVSCYVVIIILSVFTGILFWTIVQHELNNQLSSFIVSISQTWKESISNIHIINLNNSYLLDRANEIRATIYQSFHVAELVTASALINTVLSASYLIISENKKKRFYGLSANEYPQFLSTDAIAKHMKILSIFLISSTILTYAFGWEPVAVGLGMGSFVNAGILVWHATRGINLSFVNVKPIYEKYFYNDNKWRKKALEIIRKDILNNQGTELKNDHELEFYFLLIDDIYNIWKTEECKKIRQQNYSEEASKDIENGLHPIQLSIELLMTESIKQRNTIRQILDHYREYFHTSEHESLQIYIMDYFTIRCLCTNLLSYDDNDVQIIQNAISSPEVLDTDWKHPYWVMKTELLMRFHKWFNNYQPDYKEVFYKCCYFALFN